MQDDNNIEVPSSSFRERRGFDAIILAGGLGTRLRSVVADVPKCMAMVAGKPFLHYIIKHLVEEGVTNFIFSVGYKYEVIENYLQQNFSTLNYQLSIEDEPLGTGGGIALACTKATTQNVLIVNGDTLFTFDSTELYSLHKLKNADCTLALKPMQNFDRYGVVEIDANYTITSFKEKQFYKTGNINGGCYLLNVQSFLNKKLPQKFSFEKDYLEKYFEEQKFYGVVEDNYFIDIGIPEDFEKAQTELIQFI